MRQVNLREHILSEHKNEMYLPDSKNYNVGVASCSTRGVSSGSGGFKKGVGQQKVILGEIANQGLLKKLTPSTNVMTEEFSYVRDIHQPRVIVKKKTVEMMNKAIQFMTDDVKLNGEWVEVEDDQIEVIVPDYFSASGNIAVDNYHNVYIQ